jgi:hypothetical protein
MIVRNWVGVLPPPVGEGRVVSVVDTIPVLLLLQLMEFMQGNPCGFPLVVGFRASIPRLILKVILRPAPTHSVPLVICYEAVNSGNNLSSVVVITELVSNEVLTTCVHVIQEVPTMI